MNLLRLVAATAVACVTLACSEVPVVQGAAEREANRAVAVLDRAGIPSHKEADESSGSGAATFRVTVGADEVARAVSVLQAYGMPRREQAGYRETYGQASLVPGASEERARASQAIAGELARSIESIDGVIDARVHVALPDTQDAPLDGASPPRGSASVLLRYVGARAPFDDDAIRRLVAGAVAGLRADDVSVIGLSRPLPPASSDAGLTWVGPIAVARGSASRLRWALAGLLALNVFLASAAVFSIIRRRRAEAPVAEKS